MASASFGCVGHVHSAPWPRGCYCKHDWPQADVLGCWPFWTCQLVWPLFTFRSTGLVVSAGYIPHRTHRAGEHSRRSCRRCRLWGHACSVVRSHRTAPGWEKVHTKGTGRPARCHRTDVREKQCFFSKACLSFLRRALFFCVSSIRRGAPKVNNQF